MPSTGHAIAIETYGRRTDVDREQAEQIEYFGARPCRISRPRSRCAPGLGPKGVRFAVYDAGSATGLSFSSKKRQHPIDALLLTVLGQRRVLAATVPGCGVAPYGSSMLETRFARSADYGARP